MKTHAFLNIIKGRGIESVYHLDRAPYHPYLPSSLAKAGAPEQVSTTVVFNSFSGWTLVAANFFFEIYKIVPYYAMPTSAI